MYNNYCISFSRSLLGAISLLFLFCLDSSAAESGPCQYLDFDVQNKVSWRSLDEQYVQVANPVKWNLPAEENVPRSRSKQNDYVQIPAREVCFTAIRFDLRNYRISLIDVKEKLNADKSTYRGITKNIETGGISKIINNNIDSVFEYVYPGISPLVIFNAGWSEGIDYVTPIGFLKVQRVVQDFAPYKSLSALVCLDSRDIARTSTGSIRRTQPAGQRLDVLTYSKKGVNSRSNWSDEKNSVFKGCREIVQVGPKLVEKDNKWLRETDEYFNTCLGSNNKHGLCKYTLNFKQRILSILAVSQKGPDSRQHAYFIITHAPAALYDIQNILLDPEFTDGLEPIDWAVNMAGGSTSRMMVRSNDSVSGIISIGNKSSVHASALVVTKAPAE